jgi:hypothetical protein
VGKMKRAGTGRSRHTKPPRLTLGEKFSTGEKWGKIGENICAKIKIEIKIRVESSNGEQCEILVG